uniref:Uncharacterized protein n=1 Tax=Meleagris gallopavo TaxID=9103 RepID=G1NBQ5_MELGA
MMLNSSIPYTEPERCHPPLLYVIYLMIFYVIVYIIFMCLMNINITCFFVLNVTFGIYTAGYMCVGFFSADFILVCGNDESSLLRGHFAIFLFSDVSDCSFAGKVDDVLDCFCLFHHCRNAHRHCSFLEIDEYITQARDKSYETMMRVGKRGLNLAANAAVTAAAKGQGVLSEKLRSFSMQDLTLIRDEDAVHLQSHESQLRPSGGSLLETIEDSASCYSSGEESGVAQRPNGTPSEIRTDPSDEDAGDKLPKRTQSLKAPKKMTKSELPVKSVKARPKKKASGSLTSGESS